MRERDDHLERFQFGSGHPATVLEVRKRSKWWILFLLLVLGAGAGAAYLYFFEPDTAQEWLSKTPLDIKPAPSITRVYKWRDAEGNWQITDRPPPDAEYEIKEYRSDQNVVPAIEADRK